VARDGNADPSVGWDESPPAPATHPSHSELDTFAASPIKIACTIGSQCSGAAAAVGYDC